MPIRPKDLVILQTDLDAKAVQIAAKAGAQSLQA
jgi:hypothetical protein